jgi:formate/nitrite transporter FocA (FNT family)
VSAPEPEEIYARTREEGARRLERPFFELVSTGLAAGFDVIAGVAALVIVSSELAHHFGKHAAHVGGAIAFGIAFIFLVIGRGELFTENFLVPLAGLDGKEKDAWWKLGELWTVSPICNIVAGGGMAVLLSVHGVLPFGTGHSVVELAGYQTGRSWLTLFVSAIFAGALITAMTWFVEGQEAMGIRVTAAWLAAALLVLGNFDHVIVVSIELLFGMRFGAHVPWSFFFENLGVAAGGNMLGGIGLVTLNRFTQARSTGGRNSSSG